VLQTTGQVSNLGSAGNGSFRGVNPVNGEGHVTRSGAFRFDDQGYLVTPQGHRVQGLTAGVAGTPPAALGDIRISQTPPAGTELQSISIDRQGNLTEYYSDGSSVTTNQVLLQNFRDPGALTKMGDNLFGGFDAAGIIGGAFSATDNTPGTNGLGFIE